MNVVGLSLVPSFSTRALIASAGRFVSLKGSTFALSFPWLFAIWNHVNRLFYGEMKKNGVETKKENRKKGGENYWGRSPSLISRDVSGSQRPHRNLLT
jgi:hypothetical protein